MPFYNVTACTDRFSHLLHAFLTGFATGFSPEDKQLSQKSIQSQNDLEVGGEVMHHFILRTMPNQQEIQDIPLHPISFQKSHSIESNISPCKKALLKSSKYTFYCELQPCIQ